MKLNKKFYCKSIDAYEVDATSPEASKSWSNFLFSTFFIVLRLEFDKRRSFYQLQENNSFPRVEYREYFMCPIFCRYIRKQLIFYRLGVFNEQLDWEKVSYHFIYF